MATAGTPLIASVLAINKTRRLEVNLPNGEEGGQKTKAQHLEGCLYWRRSQRFCSGSPTKKRDGVAGERGKQAAWKQTSGIRLAGGKENGRRTNLL